jgi:hypothetical protein
MIVLMGAFAVYAGLLYNDFFALGLNLFASKFSWPDGRETASGTPAARACPYGACVYAFGVDPAWHVSTNELLFFNSMKMKLSVVLGIAQMSLGICLKGLNAAYFREPLDLWFEFVPMIVFDLCFFGYMVVLIFVKWSIDWDARMASATCSSAHPSWPSCADGSHTTADLCPLDFGGSGDGCQPPNLITTLMNMALMPGTVQEPLYAGQATVQVLLLLVAAACVPVLLIAKPLVLRQRMAASAPPSSLSEVRARARTPTPRRHRATARHTHARPAPLPLCSPHDMWASTPQTPPPPRSLARRNPSSHRFNSTPTHPFPFPFFSLSPTRGCARGCDARRRRLASTTMTLPPGPRRGLWGRAGTTAAGTARGAGTRSTTSARW